MKAPLVWSELPTSLTLISTVTSIDQSQKVSGPAFISYRPHNESYRGTRNPPLIAIKENQSCLPTTRAITHKTYRLVGLV